MSITNKRTKKRNTILQAAKECFAKYGYDKTTLDHIGQRCQLNKATLYYYFDNKEKIYLEVVLDEAREFISALQRKVRTIEGVENKVVTYFSERILRYQKTINLHQLSNEQRQQVEPVFLDLYKSIRQRELNFIAELLEQGAEEEDFFLEDPKDIAKLFHTISESLRLGGISFNHVYKNGMLSTDLIIRDIERIFNLIFEGIRAKAGVTK